MLRNGQNGCLCVRTRECRAALSKPAAFCRCHISTHPSSCRTRRRSGRLRRSLAASQCRCGLCSLPTLLLQSLRCAKKRAISATVHTNNFEKQVSERCFSWCTLPILQLAFLHVHAINYTAYHATLSNILNNQNCQGFHRGCSRAQYFTVKMQEGVVATSYAAGDKFYIDPMKLLPMERFLPQPKGAPSRGGGALPTALS